MRKLCLASIFIFALINCQAKNIKSLCAPKEKVVFSCALANKKIISICASPDLHEVRKSYLDPHKAKGYLYYIAGKPNKIEMKYPPNAKQDIYDVFHTGNASHNLDLDGYYFSFTKNKIIYAIYSEFTLPDMTPYQRGILTYKAGNKYASTDQRCKKIFKDKISNLYFDYGLSLNEEENLIDLTDVNPPETPPLPILKSEADQQIKEIENESKNRALHPPVTLCSKQEKVIFSCHLKNKKIVSLCASADLSKTKGYLHYLYGKKNKIEIKYPATDNIKPQLLFKIATEHSARGGGFYIDFNYQKYKYMLYSAYERSFEEHSLMKQRLCNINNGDTKLNCAKSFVINKRCIKNTYVNNNEISLNDLGFLKDKEIDDQY